MRHRKQKQHITEFWVRSQTSLTSACRAEHKVGEAPIVPANLTAPSYNGSILVSETKDAGSLPAGAAI